MSINKALIVSRLAHTGQVYGDGQPYFEGHIEKVVQQVCADFDTESPIDAKLVLQVAYLHDVLEDTTLKAEELRELGFEPAVVEAVVALTRPEGVTYLDYVKGLRSNPIAKVVKAADMKVNLAHCAPWDSRVDRYTKALKVLEELQ